MEIFHDLKLKGQVLERSSYLKAFPILREKALFTSFLNKFLFGFCVVVFLYLMVTFCGYPKVAISNHFTDNQAETLIEAQRLS